MKIINLKTNNIFNLPKNEAENLLKDSPLEFAKLTENNKIIKENFDNINPNFILTRILDE